MAIRIGPPPALARLRLYWHSARTNYMRHRRLLRDYLTQRSENSRIWLQDRSQAVSPRVRLRQRADARRKEEFVLFLDKYEELIDLLCWAAKDGVHTDRDVRYAQLRVWMSAHYYRLRPRLRPYLPATVGVFDAFESLFAPECVDYVINDDSTIENAMLTRSVINCYQDAL